MFGVLIWLLFVVLHLLLFRLVLLWRVVLLGKDFCLYPSLLAPGLMVGYPWWNQECSFLNPLSGSFLQRTWCSSRISSWLVSIPFLIITFIIKNYYFFEWAEPIHFKLKNLYKTFLGKKFLEFCGASTRSFEKNTIYNFNTLSAKRFFWAQ